MELFRLMGSILVDSSDAEQSISKTEKKADGFGKKLGNGIKTAAKWGAGLATAAGAAGAGMFALGAKLGNTADAILDLNSVTGMSTDSVQEWRKVAEVAGIGADSVANASMKLTKNLDAMSSGTNKGNEALGKLGLSLSEIEGMSADERMNVLTESLAGVDDKTERARIGTDLFGASWKEIAPAVDLGTEAMQNAKDSANIISEEDLAKANNFRITIENMKDQLSFFVTELTIMLLPALQAMANWFNDKMPLIKSIAQATFDYLGIAFNTVNAWIQSSIAWLKEWFNNNEQTLTSVWKAYEKYLGLVKDYLTFVFNTIKTVIEQVLSYIVPWVQDKLKELQKFWNENGEQIMKAVENAFQFIQKVVETVMPVIQRIIKYVWDQISTTIDAAIGVIMGLVKTFSSLLTGDFEGIKAGLTQIWESLWNGIKGLVENAWTLLSGAFSGLWVSISGWFVDLKDDALDWGANMIQGFIDGIKSMGSEVAKAASDVVDRAGDFIKFWSPAKKGEGRFITHWGRNMVDGFLDGVREETGEAGKVMNDLVASMNPGKLDFNATANVARYDVGRRGITQNRSTQTPGVKNIVNQETRPIINLTFDNNTIMDDYGVDRMMDRVIERLSLLGVRP